MKKLNNQIPYIGTELELFKSAINWKIYFSSKIKPHITGDVLEVGAGIGANTEYLKTNFVKSWSFVEPDPELFCQIESNTKKINLPKKQYFNGTILNVRKLTFDTIIYIDVLEHIEKSKEEIKLSKSLLNPNGKLIIIVPAYNFLFSNFDKHIGHFRRYDKTLLRNDVAGNLKEVKLFYVDSMGFFASLVNKIFLNKTLPNKSNIFFWDNYLVRLSIFFDRIFLNLFGKSLIAIFKNVV